MNDDASPFGTARDVPPYFAGRHSELKVLHDRLQYIRKTRDPHGGMVLVDGVQGVGKTQLLSQFGSAAVQDDHRTAILRVPAADLANPLALFAGIVHALGGDDRAAKQIADEAGGLTGAKIAGVGVSAQRGTPLGLSINAMLVRSKRGGLWQGRTLVVAVDEIQAIGVDERRTLLALHEGMHECPIMLVGAGLQHAAMRLAATMPKADGTVDESGISRFAERLTLGPLDETDASTAIVRGLEALGVDIDEARAGPLATASMGFPQHIHGYLRGAVEAAAQHGNLDSDAAIVDALAYGDAQRTRYYNERLASMERPALMLTLAKHMHGRGDKVLFWDDAASALATPDADDVLNDAIAKGVLTTDQYHRVSFGIPSFHDHMGAEAAHHHPAR